MLDLHPNQVGIDAQIFVMGEKDPMTVINPIVTEVNTEKVEMEEGCLSFQTVLEGEKTQCCECPNILTLNKKNV